MTARWRPVIGLILDVAEADLVRESTGLVAIGNGWSVLNAPMPAGSCW
jgi:hypothetical protein